jgi:hypothetical protein
VLRVEMLFNVVIFILTSHECLSVSSTITLPLRCVAMETSRISDALATWPFADP